MRNNNKGIKRRYSKKDKQHLLDELRKTLGVITQACRKCKISRETFYVWYNTEQWFHDEYDTILEEQIDFVESKLHECIDEKDKSAIIFYLKTKGKHRGFRETLDVTLQTDNIKIEFGNATIADDTATENGDDAPTA